MCSIKFYKFVVGKKEIEIEIKWKCILRASRGIHCSSSVLRAGTLEMGNEEAQSLSGLFKFEERSEYFSHLENISVTQMLFEYDDSGELAKQLVTIFFDLRYLL